MSTKKSRKQAVKNSCNVGWTSVTQERTCKDRLYFFFFTSSLTLCQKHFCCMCVCMWLLIPGDGSKFWWECKQLHSIFRWRCFMWFIYLPSLLAQVFSFVSSTLHLFKIIKITGLTHWALSSHNVAPTHRSLYLRLLWLLSISVPTCKSFLDHLPLGWNRLKSLLFFIFALSYM